MQCRGIPLFQANSIPLPREDDFWRERFGCRQSRARGGERMALDGASEKPIGLVNKTRKGGQRHTQRRCP